MHLDALLCYAAHHAGVREELLREPMRIYHITHAAGYRWTREEEGKLHAPAPQQGIQPLSYQDLVVLIAQMRSRSGPVIVNMDDWGLAGLTFPETAPAGTARPARTGG
jgi:hypothetical protein